MAIMQKKPSYLEEAVPKSLVPMPPMKAQYKPPSTTSTLGIPKSNPVPAPPPVQQKNTATAPVTGSPALGIPKSNPVPVPPNYAGITKQNLSSKPVGIADQGRPATTSLTTQNTPMPNNYVPKEGTSFVASGGKTLNDLLYDKRTYESNPNNKGLQGWAANHAKGLYGQLDSEKAKMVHGMTADHLEAYIKSLGKQSDPAGSDAGIAPPPEEGSSGSGAPAPIVVPESKEYIPAPQSTIPSLDMDEIGRYVDTQMAAELTRQTSAAQQAINAGQLTSDQQVAQLRQALARLRGDMTEQRGIENVENQRRLSPFSGRSDFTTAMIERERGKTDRQLAENQQMQEANIQANLAQLKNEISAKLLAIQQTQGAERERLIQSLRDSERAYSMQEAQLEINRQLANSQIGNTNFNQDLSAWQANRGAYEFDKNFGLQEGQLTGRYNGQSTLAGRQANLDAAFGYMDRTGRVLTPQSDWSGYARQAASGTAPLTWSAQQDNIRNDQWQQDYDYRSGQDKIRNELSGADNSRAASNAEWNQFESIWAKTGYAPYDMQLPNGYVVKAGTPYTGQADGGDSSNSKYSYKSDPDFAEEVFYINSVPNALAEIQANSRELSAKYGYEGYQELVRLATPRK